MKKFVSILFVISAINSIAQPYGNEWINYNQPHYEFKIVNDGLYNISYNTLVSAGVPLDFIIPHNFQIFAKEREIPIFIYGDEDDSFDPSDYIEFYATGNDGWIDEQLYEGPDTHTNPHYSLFNDTLTYFLTWNNVTTNLRFSNETNVDFGTNIPPYVLKRTRTVYNSNYFQGELDEFGTSLSEYTSGEGWSGPRFGLGANLSFNVSVPTPNVFSSGPLAKVRSSTASHSNSGFFPNHHLQIKYDNTLASDLQFSGYKLNVVDFTIPSNSLSSNTIITHEVIDDGDSSVNTDYHSVNYVEVEYPHTLDLSGAINYNLIIPYNSSFPNWTLELENFGGNNPLVYVLGEDPYRVESIKDGTTLKAIVKNQSALAQAAPIFISDVTQVQEINNLTKVTDSGFFTNYVNLEADSAFLLLTNKKLMASAVNYSGYRSSQGMNTLIIDVDQLYKQFGGGVEKCGIAIRRFSDFVLDNWQSPPSNLFLVGKSIRQAREVSLGARKDPIQFHLNLVPSLGYPPSDASITAGLNGTLLEPAIPTGRLSATNDQEVLEYLEKVVKFEQQPRALWKKNILHFGGGNNLAEQAQFKFYLENFKETAQDTCWGAQVFSFYKDSSLPISVNTNDSIEDLIANGITLMTFFGHAYAGGFDQDIESPETLEWNDKFPMIIGNSCFTGDIHQPGAPSTSEEFVLLANKGSIGFLSSVKLGYSFNLKDFTGEFYKQIASKNYNKSMGYQMKHTIKEIQDDGENFFIRNVCHSMTLHGDPAIVLNTVPKPDLSISASKIFFDPQEITLESDSFDVQVLVENIGKTTNKLYSIELIRHLPGSDQNISYLKELSGSYYQDTITFTLPVDQANGVGLNNFDCFVDLPSDNIDEMDDLNNNTVIGKSVNITSGGIIPIYPYNFAVHPHNTVTLKASTGDVFVQNKFYRFEVDTNDTYNSPFLQSITLNHSGGVVDWEPPILLTDSTVYFWRVGELESGNVSYWRESSFQYIPDKEGWAQAHFSQFKKDKFNLIEYNVPDRKFDFFNGVRNLTCKVIGNSLSLETGYAIDGEVQEYALCQAPPGIAVAVIDPKSTEPWNTGQYNFGNFNTYDQISGSGSCRNRAEEYFLFRQYDTGQMAGLRAMLEDSIPDGHYVLIYTLRFMSKYDWDNNAPFIYSTFNNLGMNAITASPDSVPFAFFARKGFPGNEVIELGTTISDELSLSALISINGNFGSIRSVKAGPSENWISMHWDLNSTSTVSDSISMELYGLESGGLQTSVSTVSDIYSADIFDLQDILTEEYKNAYFKATFQDQTDFTPAQLRRWHLLYETAPESAINPSIAFDFYNDELEEGELLTFYTAIENISDKDMDSLLVKYWVQDKNGQNHFLNYPRQAPLLAGEILVDTVEFNTFGFPGENTFWIEVNPFNSTTGEYDQLEQYHFNNIAQLSFKVNEDKINPILDVTFDGLHILDGDIVSPAPEIHIRLNDENPHLIMNQESDTAFFSVFLSPKSSGLLIPVNFRNSVGEEIMQFVPAGGSDNISSIHFSPNQLEDGEYQLIVIAADKSGNESGDIYYKIDFEVINASSITEILNYPNPFSTKTRFVFTLTGSQIPDYFKIEIMNISGRVVKEIFREDLGDLRIGRNITDYYWDGTDNFGDRLANGVYLYRVITRINGEGIDKLSTNADQFFVEDFGKMYLMR